MTRDQMRTSLSARRRGSLQDVLQIERDRRYSNKKYNPGEPIELDFNLNIDIEEHYQPDDYADEPPGSTQSDE